MQIVVLDTLLVTSSGRFAVWVGLTCPLLSRLDGWCATRLFVCLLVNTLTKLSSHHWSLMVSPHYPYTNVPMWLNELTLLSSVTFDLCGEPVCVLSLYSMGSKKSKSGRKINLQLHHASDTYSSTVAWCNSTNCSQLHHWMRHGHQAQQAGDKSVIILLITAGDKNRGLRKKTM